MNEEERPARYGEPYLRAQAVKAVCDRLEVEPEDLSLETKKAIVAIVSEVLVPNVQRLWGLNKAVLRSAQRNAKKAEEAERRLSQYERAC